MHVNKPTMPRATCSVLACVFIALFSPSATQSIVAINYSPPDSCSEAQFYQFGNHSCVACGTNQVAADNGLSCVCREGYVKSIQSTTQCIACREREVTTSDNRFCLTCQSPLVHSNGVCSGCGQTSIYVNALPTDQTVAGSRSCVPCPVGTWAGPTQTSCVPCGVEDCTTCSDTRVEGGVCFLAPLTGVSATPFNYYIQYLTSSIELCKNGNGTACQVVINLCVLQGYSRSDPACEAVTTLLSLKPDLVPILYYPMFGADEYLSSTTINNIYSTSPTSDDSKLIITAAMFALNGSFMGLINITDQLQLCKDTPSRAATAWRVGARYSIECMLETDLLLMEGAEPVFYDLFVYDTTSDGGGRLVPLPIHPYYYRDDQGQLVNQGSSDRWQFVRRFQLYQSVTDTPTYASSVHMRIWLKTGGSIAVPFIRVAHSNLPETTPTDVPASFSVLYRDNGNELNIGLGVTSSVFVVMAIVYTGIKENGFLRRQGSLLCELETVVFAVVQFLSLLSTMLLFLLSIASFFILVLFKGQTELLITLSEGDQEIAFITLLVVAFIARLLNMLYLIWKQVTVEIFFIDWEKPKVHAPQGDGHAPLGKVHAPQEDVPVSIWRSYFVANEWNEIQSMRRIRPIPVLLLVLLCLEVLGLVNMTEWDPVANITRPSDRYSGPHSLVLRFSVVVILYPVFAALMRVVLFLFYERFIEDKMKQFVDLCSISNVSVFILSHNLFGHYIHGRSVHGNADTDMRRMNINLIKEQENQCSRRGLIPDSDEQTFEIAITRKFRARYGEIMAPVVAERAEGMHSASAGAQGITDVCIDSHHKMNGLLQSVIDHSLPDCDHVVTRKRFLERLLGVEFRRPSDRSIFYQGQENSFTQVLFYGNEWTLLSFDILVFCIIDLVSQNYVLSAFICYLSIKLIQFVRSALGKRNLSRKTLVDSRFLI